MGRTSDARQRLLQVALDLIWSQSYRAVSVDQICEHAGVRKGSFYYFFPSKCDLALAAYEEHWRQSRPLYDRVFSPQVSPLQRIDDYCQMVYQCQKEKQAKTGSVLGCPYASVGSELCTQDERIRQKTQEIFERTCRYFESALRDAHAQGLIDRDDFSNASHSAFAYITGMLFQAKMKNDATILEHMSPTVFQLIGAKTESPAVAQKILD